MTARIALAGLAGLALSAALAGCFLEPDVGPLLPGNCSDDDTDATVDVLFSTQIRPLFSRMRGGCSCHVPSSGGTGAGTQLSGLSLDSFGSLRQGGDTSGQQIIVENQPCESVLHQKLSEAPPFGSRMPLNGPPFFSTDELRLLHDWIAEGARDN